MMVPTTTCIEALDLAARLLVGAQFGAVKFRRQGDRYVVVMLGDLQPGDEAFARRAMHEASVYITAVHGGEPGCPADDGARRIAGEILEALDGHEDPRRYAIEVLLLNFEYLPELAEECDPLFLAPC